MKIWGSKKHLVTLAACVALLGGACGGGDGDGGDAAADAEHTVRAALDAENSKDADAFLELWTDKGLESYDSGTRAEIKSGKAEGFGEDPIDILKIVDTKVKKGGKAASVELDATPKTAPVAKVVYRVQFNLIKKDKDWLINGFDFNGSPPASDAAEVIDIKAQEYAFGLSKTTSGGDVAFTFENIGKEQHELTLFKAPDGTTIEKALAAIKDVDGENLEPVPAGYKVDHVTFADIGDKLDVAFAEPLAKGTYVMACYIPQGGFGENGPVNPAGKPHVQLGMINLLTVA